MTRRRIVIAMVVLLVALYGLQCVLSAMQKHSAGGAPELPILESAAQLMLVGFRAVVVDVLWMQATELQEGSQIDESVAKYDKITRLQPDLPEVWHFLVWNIMYNLPHEVESPEDKWNLIKLGVSYADKARERCSMALPGGGQMANQMGFMMWHRFDDRTFQEAPYLRRKFVEWRGKTSFQEAIEWHDRAISSYDYKQLRPGTREIWCRQITHTLDRWTSQTFADCDQDGALRPAREAVSGKQSWQWVAGLAPGDPDHPEVDLNLQFLKQAKWRLKAIEEFVASKKAAAAGDLAGAERHALESVSLWQQLTDAWPSGPDTPCLRKADAWVERLTIKKGK